MADALDAAPANGQNAAMEGEGIGEAVSGALIARAIEPETGKDGHTDERACLNCGAPLVGDFCHSCGQRAHVHRTLAAFWHDLVHAVLHFEGKIWRTLPLLAWKPGELTRRYIHGERAKFVSPMAMFLFSVFLMFAIFSTLGGPIDTGPDKPDATSAEESADARQTFERDRAKTQAKLARMRAERARLAAAGQPTIHIDVDIRNTENELELEKRVFEGAMALAGEEEKPEAEPAKAEATPDGNAATADSKVDGSKESEDSINVSSKSEMVNNWFADAYKRAKENPKLLIYKLQTNAYKFSWALIPISVPFVWLLFLHRRRYRQYKVYDHTIFVTYSLAFMGLGLIVLTLLKPLGLGKGLAVLAMTFIPPIHMYRQLRGAYQLRWWSAAWRTFLLLNFAFIAVSLFFVLLLALGVLG